MIENYEFKFNEVSFVFDKNTINCNLMIALNILAKRLARVIYVSCWTTIKSWFLENTANAIFIG